LIAILQFAIATLPTMLMAIATFLHLFEKFTMLLSRIKNGGNVEGFVF